MCPEETSIGGYDRNSIRQRLYNVTAYACVFSDTFSLQEDIVYFSDSLPPNHRWKRTFQCTTKSLSRPRPSTRISECLPRRGRRRLRFAWKICYRHTPSLWRRARQDFRLKPPPAPSHGYNLRFGHRSRACHPTPAF